MILNKRQETREKISSLWEDKIIWIPYAYEDFLKDIKEDIAKILIPQGSRWGHFIYALFHIFTHLKDYDYALYLDTDILILDSIEDLLAKDIDARGVNVGDSFEVARALEILNHPITQEDLSKPQKPFMSVVDNPISLQNPFKPNAAFLSFNCCILEKFGKDNPTQKCFEYLKLIAQNHLLPTQSGSNEAPFGILAHIYKIKFDFIETSHKVAILPRQLQEIHKILHAYSDSKFWNTSLTFVAFQEWFVNHKIWEKINGKKPLTFKPDNLGGLTSPHKLYHFLWNLNALLPLYHEIYKRFLQGGGGQHLRLMPLLDSQDRFLKIHSSFFMDNVFYQIAANEGLGTSHIYYELQIMCKNNNLLESMKNIATSNNFTLLCHQTTSGEIIDSYITFDISTLSTEQKIQALERLISLTFNTFYKAIYHQDFIPFST